MGARRRLRCAEGRNIQRERRRRPDPRCGDKSVNYGEEQMGRSVEILAIILFGVIGLSHILQPKAWAEFFILLRGKREAGAFIDGFLDLPLGAFIVGFHNIWSGIPVVLTLLGWALFIKGLI